MTNCPFYGRHMYRTISLVVTPPFYLIDQHGNQCALITNALAPCQMEVNGDPVDWAACPRVRDARMESEP